MLLKGKKALVTGSSSGIGKKIVKNLLDDGVEVYGFCSCPSESREELISYAGKRGTHFYEINADFENPVQITVATREALTNSGGFDILINTTEVTKDEFSYRKNSAIDFVINRIISSEMKKKKTGLIINIPDFKTDSLLEMEEGIGA